MLELLAVVGLRRSELLGLDVADVDHERRRLSVRRKGGLERTWCSVPRAVWRSLGEWLAERPATSGTAALFLTFDRRGPGARRLSERGLYEVVSEDDCCRGWRAH